MYERAPLAECLKAVLVQWQACRAPSRPQFIARKKVSATFFFLAMADAH